MSELNLNKARGRKVLECIIADKSFRIEKVVIGVRQKYSAYAGLTAEILQKAESLTHKQRGESDEDYQERVERISKEVDGFVETKRTMYFDMIGLILEKNGYELNTDWWDNNTDELDQQGFLEACLMKDTVGNTKKKKMENP